MRTPPVAVLALAALLTASGCASETPEEPQEGAPETAPAAGEEEAVERVFGAGEQITVDLTLYATEDGGRSTPFFSGYRPTAEFDHLDQSVSCSVQLPADLDQFAPGETHMVGLECGEEVTVHVDEPGLVLIESGKENGEGEVVFTEI
ncbi:hypothetical protein [Nocardiopsis ganjiahuensis]|uniref:hypothetical protein n=1 Tax=Nocardiopsis ganjiahuensis TaxID=239984 RepID=UPI000345E643|nr:hypothetical protein [Nocardiopsis ganjiahuensis]